jgi:hypothetical protein
MMNWKEVIFQSITLAPLSSAVCLGEDGGFCFSLPGV